MNLPSVVGDEAARRNRFHALQVVFRARINPPCSGDDGDEAVIRMKMGAAVVMRQPLLEHYVEARLGRVTNQHRHFRTGRGVDGPLDVLGKLDRNRLGIELSSSCNSQRHEHEHYYRKADCPPYVYETKHCVPPGLFRQSLSVARVIRRAGTVKRRRFSYINAQRMIGRWSPQRL